MLLLLLHEELGNKMENIAIRLNDAALSFPIDRLQSNQ